MDKAHRRGMMTSSTKLQWLDQFRLFSFGVQRLFPIGKTRPSYGKFPSIIPDRELNLDSPALHGSENRFNVSRRRRCFGSRADDLREVIEVPVSCVQGEVVL